MQRWLRLAAAALMSVTVMSCGDDGGCPTGFTDCGGFCFNLDVDPRNCGTCGNTCGVGEVCGAVDGEAAAVCSTECAAGQEVCGNACVTLTTDRLNCGSCGNACAAGEFCSAGTCGVECGGGTTVCDGECRDLMTDPNHCGVCGSACAGNEVCSGGTCAFSCGGGLTDCSGSCIDTTRDRDNCGGCGTVCPSNSLCVDSACEVTCAPGLALCDGACTDTSSDTANCGGCGVACGAGQVCRSGSCNTECGGATPDLCTVEDEGVTVESCVDFRSNPDFCGDCATACADGEVCSRGVCGVVCETGFTDCDGACVDLTSNPNFCGACEGPEGEPTSCPDVANGTPVCAASICGAACSEGFFDCNLDAAEADGDGCEVDLMNDRQNCGGCGVTCAFTEDCVMGACAAAGPGTRTGASCDSPFILTTGANDYMWTDANTMADHFTTRTTCSFADGTGPDIVFGYVAPADGPITFSVTPPSSTRWDMQVTDSPCGDLSGFIDCDSQFGNEMTISVDGVAGTTYYLYLRDTTSGSNPLDNPVEVTIGPVPAPMGCGLGESGIVAGTITRRPTGLSSFTEYEMVNVSGGASMGELLIGSTSSTLAIDKATDTVRDIERLAPLLNTEQGYTLAVAGDDWFTIDDTTTGTNRVYRISTDGGVTFLPVPEVVGTSPGGAADEDIRGSYLDGTTLVMVGEETSTTSSTEIYTLDTAAPYPQVLGFTEISGHTDCDAITADATNYYIVCDDGSEIVEINKATNATRVITTDIDPNSTKNNIVAVDTTSPPDGTADILYVNNGDGSIHYVCDFAGTSPFIGNVGRVSTGTSFNFGLAYDPVTSTIFAWDDDTRDLVVIQ